jgi:hypothetical protein
MMATTVQGLAIVLVAVIAYNRSLPAKAKWPLLLLALIAGLLATLRKQGILYLHPVAQSAN